MKYPLIISIAAIVFIATGEALQCISCVEGPIEMTSEFPLSNCNDPLGLQSSPQCWDAIFCIKSVADYKGEVAIVRHCVSPMYLNDMKGINEEMLEMSKSVKVSVYGLETETHFCASNFCNNSSTLFITTTLFILILLMFIGLITLF